MCKQDVIEDNYLQSHLICHQILFWQKKNMQMFKLCNLLIIIIIIGLGKQKAFCGSQWQTNWKARGEFCSKKHEKKSKNAQEWSKCLSWEIRGLSKLINLLLVYLGDNALGWDYPQNFTVAPQTFASWPIKFFWQFFSLELYPLIHQCWKGFIYKMTRELNTDKLLLNFGGFLEIFYCI